MAYCQCCGICGCKIEADEGLSDHQQINSLEAQLNAIFILKHIYELRSDQLECYLQTYGNPGDWLKFCRNCEEDVLNVRGIFENFHEISRKFKRGKRALEEKIKYPEARKSEVTTKFKDAMEETFLECRRAICNRNSYQPTPQISPNPFEAGDRKASKLAMEMDPELQEDAYYCTDLDDEFFLCDQNSFSSAETNNFEAEYNNNVHEDKEEEVRSPTPEQEQRKIITTGRSLNTCPLCGKSFSTASNARRHTKSRVCQLPQFSCNECKFQCEKQKLLDDHLSLVHGIIRPTRFYQKCELDLRIVTLSEDKKSGTCNICRKQYATIKKLKMHCRWVHRGLFFCSWESCGKTYTSESSLRQHIKTCHENMSKVATGPPKTPKSLVLKVKKIWTIQM